MNISKKSSYYGKILVKKYRLFYVDLVENENNKNVYKLEWVADLKMTIEPPELLKVISQCTNCQQLGQTKSLCKRFKMRKVRGKRHSCTCNE